jgi:cell division protease FtsH
VLSIHFKQVSIVWRGNALGFTQSHESERSSEQQGHYLDNIAVLMAGRAAEDVFCGTISSGSYGDLKMVCMYYVDVYKYIYYII